MVWIDSGLFCEYSIEALSKLTILVGVVGNDHISAAIHDPRGDTCGIISLVSSRDDDNRSNKGTALMALHDPNHSDKTSNLASGNQSSRPFVCSTMLERFGSGISQELSLSFEFFTVWISYKATNAAA